jgi:transcriptional regulator with GAF, ATPase, and Fis domain
MTPIPTDPDQALSALLEATVAFAEAETDSDATLPAALQHLIRVTGADAGAVAVADAQGRPRILAQHSLGRAGPVSRTALEATLAVDDPGATITEPPVSASVVDASITSILCTPVRRQGKTLAAVYLDRRDKPPFDEVASRLAAGFASVLALALDLTRQRDRAEEQAEEARATAAYTRGFWRFGAIDTKSRRFAECLQLAERAAKSDVSLLLLGETGSGKEHLARCVHAQSQRRDGPFLTLNCAAIPEPLLESELFGHEKGAFTGAIQTHRGKFELAQGGTLFLDEIGEMPLGMQPKLLRVLDDRRVSRLGGAVERQVDVRIVAATNRDLAEEVRQGRFREDLYYRLNVVSVTIPPLRERVEDIAPLAEAFLQQACRQARRKLAWDEAALRRLGLHPWPGNVRELRNAVEKLCVLAEGPKLRPQELEAYLFGRRPEALTQAGGSAAGAGSGSEPARRALERLREAIEEFAREAEAAWKAAAASASGEPAASGDGSFREQMDAAARRVIAQAIREAGSVRAAAKRLGLSRQHLYFKCKALGLETP